MKITGIFIGMLCLSLPLLANPVRQVRKKTTSEKIEAQKNEPSQKQITYDAAGRRDPFKDLLTGIETGGADSAEGIAQIAVDNIVLSGIIKVKGKLTAIISDPKGFPLYVKKGDKFIDGYILSIKPTYVVFLKTRERGITLNKPKEVIKRLYDEEY